MFGFGGLLGMWIAQPRYVPPANVLVEYPTGYQVFDELNKYRAESGLKPLILWQPLCNNIASRAASYKKTNSHEGLHEFVVEYMPEVEVSEILAAGESAKIIVDQWKGSPSHDLTIKSNSRACVYSAEGYAVGLLAK